MSNKCFLDQELKFDFFVMKCFMTQWGLKEKKITLKFVCFGVDGSTPSKALNLEL
jgi:hypothetical protein